MFHAAHTVIPVTDAQHLPISMAAAARGSLGGSSKHSKPSHKVMAKGRTSVWFCHLEMLPVSNLYLATKISELLSLMEHASEIT